MILNTGDVNMAFFNEILLTSTKITGGEINSAVQNAGEAVTQVAGAAGVQPQATGFGMWGMVLYILALIGLFYFFAIRPQKKKEKELTAMQNSIKLGDWVMTSSGFYGKVVDIADEVFVVEFGTNKGVRIPIRKSEIIGNKEPNLSNKPNLTKTEAEEK